MLSGVVFVSAVGFEIPPVEKGSFDNVFLPCAVRRSLNVDTRSEVETPSDPGGCLIGQRRNRERVRLCVPFRVAVTKKNRSVRSGDLPCPFRSQ